MKKYMIEALKEAKKAFELGEVPIGAVIVKDNKIISRAFNKKSILLWLVIIIMISLGFLSYKVIDFFKQARTRTNIFKLIYGNLGNIFIISSINDSNKCVFLF